MQRPSASQPGTGLAAARPRPSLIAHWFGIGVVAALAVLVPDAVFAQYLPEQIFEFQNLGNSMGYSSAAGDVNGDGRDDLVLGAVFDDINNNGVFHLCNAGAVTIITGGTSDPPNWQLVAEIFNPDLIEDAAFGYSVAAGDVNGDGIADVVVGAPLADPGGLANSGSVFVYIAPNWTSFAARRDGENPQDNFGTSVAVTGDIDGDGFNDVVVGAPRYDPPGIVNAGRVYGLRVNLPNLDQQWATSGQSAGEFFGRSVDGGGRLVVGGPRRDVLAGAPVPSGGLGRARGLRGTDGLILGTANAPPGAVRFGEAVRFIPDLNGDGRDDSLIGIPGSKQISLYLSMGGSPQWTITDLDAGMTEFGAAITLLANFRGDGGFEFAVGAPGFGSGSGANRGRVRVFEPVGTSTASEYLVLTGTAGADRFGFSLARANIVGSGSQRNDLVVGAPFADGRNIAESGIVSAFNITSLPETQIASLAGTYSGENFGEALAFRRATTLAPREDWLVMGMPSGDLPAPVGTVEHSCDAGRVFVYSGEGVFQYSLAPGGPAERFGTAVAAVSSPIAGGNVDEYIIVGAPQAVAASSQIRSGVIRVFQAQTGGPPLLEHSPDMDEGGDHLGAEYGTAIARLGDVILDTGGPDDGEEIAVGAPGADASFVDAGKVYIYTVRVNPLSLLFRVVLTAPPTGADRTGARFGSSVSGPGNLDTAGGHPPAEILVGAPLQTQGNMAGAGEAYIFAANVAGTLIVTNPPRATLFSVDPLVAADDRFGTAVSGAGTLTGTGPDFVAVGVPGGNDASGLNVGRVEIFDNIGIPVASIPNPNMSPGAAGENFGQALAKIDLAGTTTDGFLVGDPAFFDGVNTPGRAFIFFDPSVTGMIMIPFVDILPPPLSGEIAPPLFGQVVAHSPNTMSSLLGRSLISATFRDVEDAFGYRSANPRIHRNPDLLTWRPPSQQFCGR